MLPHRSWIGARTSASVDRLVVRQEHRDQAGVGRALDIVLPAQRMQARARPADLAGDQRERDQAAGVVGAVDVLGNAHAPEYDRLFRPGEFARDRAQLVGIDATDRRHLLRREGPDMLGEGREALDMRLHILLVVELFRNDHVEQRIQQRDIRPALELQHVAGVAAERLAARIGDDQGRAAPRRLFQVGRRDRVVLGRVGADDEDDVAVLAGGERRGDGAGADALEQRGDRRGVTEPGAVVDIVGAEAGAHQLLEQIGFLVGALGRAEAGKGVRPLFVPDTPQAAGGFLQRFLPARFPEEFQRVRRIHDDVGRFRRILAPDQRFGQALRAVGIVEAEAALHAQPLLVGRAVAAVDREQLAVLQIVGDLAADAAIGADALDLLIRKFGAHARIVQQVGRHQRPGRAGLHAFPARHAGAGAHRIVHVEHDLRTVAAQGHADDVVRLNFAAGPDAQVAVDAGVQMHRHRRVADIRRRHCARRQAACLQIDPAGPVPEAAVGIVGLRLCRLIGQQHLEHHLARGLGPVGDGMDRHAFRRLPDAGGGQHPLALDLDHAGAAVAVGPVARLVGIAEMRDFRAQARRDLPDRFARCGNDGLTVQREADRFAHGAMLMPVSLPLQRRRKGKRRVKHVSSTGSRDNHEIGTNQTTQARDRSRPVRGPESRTRSHRPEYTPGRFSSMALTASR